MQLDEVGGGGPAERSARDDAHHVAALGESFFEEPLFGEFGEAVNIADARDAARQHSPEQREPAARFRKWRERNDGRARAML